MTDQLDRIFLTYTVDKLDQLTSRIDDCLGRLTEEQIWDRGSENENAVGNLVLHLCGNLRQWIGAGVAGQPDIRVRDREFQARGSITTKELRERLDTAVGEAADIIRHVSEERLKETINVQGYDIRVLEAIMHVLEHFAQHTGQILFATKLMTHADLGYYRHLHRGGGHEETTP